MSVEVTLTRILFLLNKLPDVSAGLVKLIVGNIASGFIVTLLLITVKPSVALWSFGVTATLQFWFAVSSCITIVLACFPPIVSLYNCTTCAAERLRGNIISSSIVPLKKFDKASYEPIINGCPVSLLTIPVCVPTEEPFIYKTPLPEEL